MPSIFSACSLSPFPSHIDDNGAPPCPTNAENADIKTITGNATPTPVSASTLAPGIWPI